jgi:hypothetical protein
MHNILYCEVVLFFCYYIMPTQLTRIKNTDGTETLRRHSDGTTMSYSTANVTTLISGQPTPIVYVLKRIDNNYAYPFTLQTRDQTEFTAASFDTVWTTLLGHPDQPFGKLT